PEIESPDSPAACVLNCLPEQERHCAQIMSTCIRGAILVNHSAGMPQRDHAGDGAACVRRHSNLEPVAKARYEVAEPTDGLRRRSMPPPRQNEKGIELFEKRF